MSQPEKPVEFNPQADVDGVASFLGVPRSWVYDRTRRGAIPMRRVGKYVRFDLAEIRAWAKAGCPVEWEGEEEAHDDQTKRAAVLGAGKRDGRGGEAEVENGTSRRGVQE